MRTAILSNGSPKMLDAVVKAAKLDTLLDAVLSVEDVGVYKPNSEVYQLAVDRLGIPAASISFQSSNAWDAYAASAFGMKVVWCNRYGQRPERLPGAPDRQIQSLAELPRSRRCPVRRSAEEFGMKKTTLGLAIQYALSDGIPLRSIYVALVVGTTLNLINQGDALLGPGHITGSRSR